MFRRSYVESIRSYKREIAQIHRELMTFEEGEKTKDDLFGDRISND
jgi:hypothetical protein